MHLIQILLPLRDNAGMPFADAVMASIHKALVGKFGGLTAFTRSPAEGVWADGGKQIKDDVVAVEVIAGNLDQVWWRSFRTLLEERLKQERVLIWAQEVEPL